ncbi:hypothetical protein [Neptunicoccus cionae]|uniref:Uncharacterized protein n=1 Tax=Neptunicoccus cionae TaxID=2035344 RepID=A0A916QWG6_9RHOB|nr:hypothetical protein [Amylibacter cionae]GGA15033.1 hypothetical protein GCM10011498_14160 [Amylibacter cionae]
MASRYHATENPRETTPEQTCSNAPDPHVLRTSQTLQAKAEVPPRHADSREAAPRLVALFHVLQARYG